ncbi:PTS system N,N'-diacetylchitobiose-specific IIC component (Lac family) [Hypnocyclicus thermotrophus]|uniref:Permease IIC component n=1 Tax=Hypnocyclicus thermotrophus TaxID=1627895 RepID=A0AA46E189_9FUSO|nr:PTS cellobiose transporter subunit IIC [Hypnocyclicus thermotrophus]TDT72478.1 PTS system N,N'-diacetylchitobiose-specific IIC component (Lac family) [Hypnocyclicus thermotrophus]
MSKMMNFVEEKLLPIAGKMASNKHLTALKDGFVFTMPFLIIGSIVLLLVNLPISQEYLSEGIKNPIYMKWYADLMAAHKANWVQPFYVSMGIMSLFVSFGIGYSLSQQYGLNNITGGFLSLFTFLLTSAKLDWLPVGQASGASNLFHIPDGGWMPVMDARYLDAKGLFTAIICAFVSVEVFKILVKAKLTIKLPDSVPPAIARSFELLTPIIAMILIFQPISIIVQKVQGVMIPELIMRLFQPLVSASDSLPAVISILIIVHVLWFAGLHGVNVVVAIINPIILSNLAANQAALQAGEVLPKIFAGGFLDSFVYLGGSGATLGLAIAMSRSRVEHLRSIGKISIVPGLFNINEPVIFGSPIVMNPILFIPFVTVPIINATIAWFAVKSGLVGKIITLVPWTTPAPIAAFFATNFNFMAFVLSLGLIVLSTIIYIPFLKIYEDSLLKEEETQTVSA